MGTVWRAWDERLKRRVAAKQIRADATISHIRARLRREAQAVARLNHPSIVHIYDFVEDDGGDWIIMELVSGQTLRQRLAEKGPLPPAMAVRLGCEIAEGLGEAHAFGILHRDLKAANVMVTPAGRTKILDFGLAKELAQGGTEQDQTLSAPGGVIGTAYAMSPEQALGRDLDARSDLFSLGALLYEALTGSPPFLGESPTASMARVLSYQPPPLGQAVPGLPPALADLVEHLLEKEPARRPGSASEVVEALTAIAAGEGKARAAKSAPDSQTQGSTLLTLDQRPPAQTSSESEHRRTLSERRLLTVVCCGLVERAEGSGEAGFLDLEALSESMASFQELAREVCERRSGSLGATLGHLLWLYFGYPHTHEDDVQRAARTARELTARIGEVGARLGPRGTRLALRVALHTGPAAVISRAGEKESLQLGSVLDLVTSLQSTAPVGQVVVSGASRKLMERDFTTEPLTPVHVPGAAQPVSVYQVVGETGLREKESGESTLLVGRAREIELLEDRFRLACSGIGQAVMIAGEAGIGKSRLVKALHERLAAGTPVWWVAYGSPAAQNSPLAPMIELLDRIVSSSGEFSPGGKLDRLEELLQGSPIAESLPLLAYLLSLPQDGGNPPLDLSPEAQRKRTFEALVGLLAEMAERQVLVLVIEDLHWLDPSSLELLDFLLEEISALPLLVIATYRPELRMSWEHRSYITQLALSRLTDTEAMSLIDRLTGDGEIPGDARQQILARTDGVPLFIEELTKAVLEGGPHREMEIPTTLDGSLAARFDRLGAGKEVAQIAAVIGRNFSPRLLRAIAPLEAAAVQRGLDELVRAELVHRRGTGPRARYAFKHALIQDAAYASLLTKDRQNLHLRIARVLESHLANAAQMSQEVPLLPAGGDELLLLAHHWSHAVDVHSSDPSSVQKAITHLLSAGEHTLKLSAYKEACSHLEAALGLIPALPEGNTRDEQELLVQIRLSTVLQATRGWASPAARDAYTRARELCLKLENRPELPQTLFVLWGYHLFYGEFESARILADELLRQAEPVDLADRLMAHCALAGCFFWLGRLPESLRHAEVVLNVLATELHASCRLKYGSDPRIIAAQFSILSLWLMGCPEEALARHARSSELAAELAHPFTSAIALTTSVTLHRCRQDLAGVREAANRLIVLAQERGFPNYALIGSMNRDWTISEEGQPGAVIDDLLQGFALYPQVLGEVALPLCSCVVAMACRRAGRFEQAFAVLDEGLRTAHKNDELVFQAEIHCLRAQLFLDQGERDGQDREGLARQAMTELRRALELAQGCLQTVFAERAGSSLLFLLEQAGRHAEAREIRVEIDRFGDEARGRARRLLDEARRAPEDGQPAPNRQPEA
jgi:serine/threonine protein kinase/tetratricopeptide (TPR) repeat protein